MPKDPVCGMEVNEEEAPARAQFEGQTYYFCCEACRKRFKDNPEEYVEGEGR